MFIADEETGKSNLGRTLKIPKAGTMVYAKTQSKEAVRAFLGHTNDVTMRHYVYHGESLDEEAERFYSFSAPLPLTSESKIMSA